jgi:hypothetical protein
MRAGAAVIALVQRKMQALLRFAELAYGCFGRVE